MKNYILIVRAYTEIKNKSIYASLLIYYNNSPNFLIYTFFNNVTNSI